MCEFFFPWKLAPIKKGKAGEVILSDCWWMLVDVCPKKFRGRIVRGNFGRASKYGVASRRDAKKCVSSQQDGRFGQAGPFFGKAQKEPAPTPSPQGIPGPGQGGSVAFQASGQPRGVGQAPKIGPERGPRPGPRRGAQTNGHNKGPGSK